MEQAAKKTATPVADIIQERRSIRVFKEEPVSQELIEQLLGVAVWAPNHLNRQPWRFILFQGESRKTFAQAMVETYSAEERTKYGEPKRQYLEQVPAHLIVVLKEDPRQKVWDEDYAAVCCLIQNFQLAAWEAGLGVVWKTNHYGYEPEFREAVGVHPGEKISGVLHIGYPRIVPEPVTRKSITSLLTIHS